MLVLTEGNRSEVLQLLLKLFENLLILNKTFKKIVPVLLLRKSWMWNLLKLFQLFLEF